MPTPERPGVPSRRAVLRAGLGLAGVGTAALLGGCRLRLEDDAPAVPFVPRKSIDDEALLVEGYRQTRELAALAASVSGSELARSMAAAHDRQAQVLRAILTEGGVPASVIEPPPADTTSSPSTAPSASPPAATAATLAAAQAAAASPEALGQLAGAVAQRPLLTAVTAHRASAATLLGAGPHWPDGPALPPDAAASALEPTREALYATEVAAARVSTAARAAYLPLLATLQRRAAQLRSAAGAQADDGAVAYRLPFAVTSPDDAHRLVGTALDGLVAHGLDPLSLVPAGSASVAEVARLQAEAAVLRHQWGGPLTAFPGLADG
ncbi:MAG: hypothetical protein ACOYBY_10435 [Dermatophilaceae bacterium]